MKAETRATDPQPLHRRDHARALPRSGLAARIGLALTCLLVLLRPESAAGNGGAVRVADAVAGPFVVSVFTDPNPLVVGWVDVSVLVRHPDGSVVDGADVWVVATGSGTAANVIRRQATRAEATNKLYYAAKFEIAEPGPWRFAVTVEADEGQGRVEFGAEVVPASVLDEPLVLGAMLAAPLLAVAWWIWRRSRGPQPNDGKSPGG